MAEASIPVRYLDGVTTCSICTEAYTDPRVLPCIHTYCLRCIVTWGKGKQPGDRLACPLCRTKVTIPAGGIAALPKNWFMDRLLEMKKLGVQAASKDRLCDVCGDDGRKTKDAKIVKVYCVDCQQRMCQQCTDYHAKMRMSRTHKLVRVDREALRGGTPGELIVALSENFCDVHSDERLKLFCFDCRSVVCMMCYVKDHKSHECGDVKEVAVELGTAMKVDVENVAGKLTECSETLLHVNRADRSYTDHVNKVEREICRRADDLKRLIDDRRDCHIEELRAIKRVYAKKIDALRDELQAQIEMMESFWMYAEELMDKGTACDVVRAAGDLRARAKELAEYRVIDRAVVDRFRSDVTFSFDCTRRLDEFQDWFGKLDTDTSFPTSVKPLFVVPKAGDWIGGVTSLGDEVFVVRHKSLQQLEVYDARTMSQTRQLQVPGLGPEVYCGLAACSVNRCLYVSDHANNLVHRIKLLADGEPSDITRWSVGISPSGLSIVDATHNVLLAGWGTDKLQEFTTNGTLVREIALQSGSIQRPNHVVHMPGGVCGVTHQSTDHGFSVVDAGGQVVRSYGCASGSSSSSAPPSTMSYPHGVAVNQRGFVFVADKNNNRVVVLNPETFACRELPVNVDAGSRQLRKPMCLWLDESRDRLYVGEAIGGRVIVVSRVNNLTFTE